jgi:hypothetical protein
MNTTEKAVLPREETRGSIEKGQDLSDQKNLDDVESGQPGELKFL